MGWIEIAAGNDLPDTGDSVLLLVRRGEERKVLPGFRYDRDWIFEENGFEFMADAGTVLAWRLPPSNRGG